MQLIPLLQTGAPVGQPTTLAATGTHVSFAAAFDKLAASDTAQMVPTDVDTPARSDTAPTVSAEDDLTDTEILPVGMEESESEESLEIPPMPVGLDSPAQHTKTNAEMSLRPSSESRLIYAVQFDRASQSSAGATGSDTGTDGTVALTETTAGARPIVAHPETAEMMLHPADHGPDAPQIATVAAGRPIRIAGPVAMEGGAAALTPTVGMRETATLTEKTAPVLDDGSAASAALQQPSPRQAHLTTHAPAVHQSAAPIPQPASVPTDARLENQQQTPIATVIIRSMASPAQAADVEPPTTSNPAAPQHPPTNPATLQPTVTRNVSAPRLAPTQPLTAVSAANPSTDLEGVEGQIETALADIRTPGPTSVQSHIPTAQAAPQHQHATVAKQIANAAQNSKDRQIELTLSPAELGKVRMSLSSTDAGVSVLIHADRSETLDLMRRNIGDLEGEFADMGYGDVDFAFSGGDDAQDRRGDHPQSHGTPSHADGPDVVTASNVSGDTPLSSETSMDIRI